MAECHLLQDEHYDRDGWSAAFCLQLQAASESILRDWRADNRQTAAKHAMKRGSMAWSFLWLEFLDYLEGRSSGV